MTYKINFETYSNNFAVPNDIITTDFDKLNPLFIKVILLIFQNSAKDFSSNLMSNLLKVDEAEINDAINFWINRGILSPVAKGSISVEPAVVLSKKPDAPTLVKSESAELTYLIQSMGEQLNRPVTSAEYKTIMHILEFVGLPADVILMAVSYCISIEKTNVRYIEKICTIWADNEITTHEKAEQYLTMLEQSKQSEAKIKKIFGINDRALLDMEKNYISTWINTYKFDTDIIALAYEKTITAINKLSFQYLNKILDTWYKQGIKTAKEVSGEQQKFSKNARKDNSSSYDIDEIDKFWDNVPKLV